MWDGDGIRYENQAANDIPVGVTMRKPKPRAARGKLTLERTEAAGLVYFVVVDAAGYPIAQGSEATCKIALNGRK